MTRIAITGTSLRTSLGSQTSVVVDRLLAGEHAFGDGAPARARIHDALRPSRHRRFLKRMGLFALEVGHDAWASSKSVVAGERLGLYFGYGGLRAHWEDLATAFRAQQADGRAHDAWNLGLRHLHPFWMLGHLSNNAHALFGIDVGARGDGLTLAGGNASAQAIAAASDAIRAGVVDAAIVVGYDTLLEPETELALDALGIATRRAPGELRSAHDRGANGVALGEAAGALVLEREDVAGARAIAFVDAAAGADGASGWPQVAALEHVLGLLLRPRGTAFDGSSCVVDGAGRAELAFDAAERAMLTRALADSPSSPIPLLSTASALGHLGGASAVVQTIVLAEFLRRGELPPAVGLVDPAAPTAGPLVLRNSRATTGAKIAFGLSAHPPGLVGAVRVEVP